MEWKTYARAMDDTYRPSCSVESSVRTVCNVWHGVCIYWGLGNVNMINNPTDTFAALRCTKEFMRAEFIIALLMYIR